MKAKNKILICGGSIAGPSLAYWLLQYGHSVVVAEKSKSFRDGGQNVDIKGRALDVVRMMGLEQQIAAKDTGEKGLKLLNASGNVVASIPRGSPGSLTSQCEILRGDLSRIIYEATKDKCDYRFGAFVTHVAKNDNAVAVTFNDGSTEEFELVICADGVGSSTRKLVMDQKIHFRYFGVYASFFRIPKHSEDDHWAYAYNGKGGSFVLVRPGHDNDATVVVTFLRKDFESEANDASTQKQMLRDVLTGAGGLADRVIADLDYDQDLYFGPLSQIKAKSWSDGRIALLGDAAYCPTPFTGLGTSLALVGAYVLAGEINRNETYAEAFHAYEKILRPYVERGQKINTGGIRLMHQKSAIGISILGLAAKLFASKSMQNILQWSGEWQKRPSEEDFVLPRYS